MNKPLIDWTLGEIKAECEKRPCVHRPTNDCPFYGVEGCAIKQATEKRTPNNWDLSEPHRWTEQDKEDARKIKEIFPERYTLGAGRLENGKLKLSVITEVNFVWINDALLPSLKAGEKVMLDEILLDKEQNINADIL